jgi:HSP20 family protein
MPVMERWTPFHELDLLDQRIRRMLPGFGLSTAPSADVYEHGDEYVVELEVPGYGRDELEVEVIDHTLTVKGERREETEETARTMRVHERLATTFERSFMLPAEVDTEHLEAAYGKGVLTLHLPKTVEATPRRVEITTS